MKQMLKRGLAMLMTVILLMTCTAVPAFAEEMVTQGKYLLTIKNLTVTNNGLDGNGNPFKGDYNNTDQYLYFNPASTSDGKDFTVSFTYELPAGYYKVKAAYKCRSTAPDMAEFSANGQVLGRRSMKSGSIIEQNDAMDDLVLETAGTVTFAWTVTEGSSNYMTLGNVELTAYDPENQDTFRFESEKTPFTTVDAKGVQSADVDGNDWFWDLAMNKSGIAGVVSGDLAYYNAPEVDGYVEYTLPATAGMKPGEYTLYWGFRPNSQTYSTLRVDFGDEHLMDVSQKHKDVNDGVMGWANVMMRLPLGVVNVKADGTDTVRLTLLSAEGAPNKGFTSDYFELISTSHRPADSAARTRTVEPVSTDLVDVYSQYSMYDLSTTYKLTADGVSVPVVEYVKEYDYAAFSLKKDEPVEITVEYTGEITTYDVTPQKDNIPATASGNKLTLTLDRPTYLIVRVNDAKRLVIAVDEPEKNVPDPEGEGVFNILDYGADPTGAKLATDAIQAAIDDAAEYGAAEGNGQGVIYVPDGVYSVTNIQLKSNTNLYLAGGSVLRLAEDHTAYKLMAQKVSLAGTNMTAMITTEDGGKNISLTGRGTIDGQGKWARSVAWTVTLLLIRSCENFLLDGPLFRESSLWAIVPAWCKDSTLQNFKVLNNTSFNEDDAVDVVGGKNVLIRHAIGITNDDTYSTKTYILREDSYITSFGNGPAIPLDNVTFEDCTAWSHCYAFKSGQGIAQEQRNLTVKDSVVFAAAVGFGIHHHQNGDDLPHDIREVVYENIDIERLSYNIWGNSAFCTFIMDTPTNHKSGGHIGEITVRNINIRKRGSTGSKLQGSTWKGVDWSVNNVTFENITMEGKVATSLTELGFKGKNGTNTNMNPGLDYVHNSTGCYVINPANALIPAQYYYSGENVSVVDDAAAETDQALTTTGETTLRYMNIDFGDKAEALNVRYKAEAAGEATVAIGTPDKVVGTLALDASGDYSVASLPIEAITGPQDIYITLPAGVTLDYLQPYTDVTEPPVPEYTPGDVDKSGAVDVADIMKLKALIMADKWSDEELRIGNLDGSDRLDVGDIMAVKNIIMVS